MYLIYVAANFYRLSRVFFRSNKSELNAQLLMKFANFSVFMLYKTYQITGFLHF